MYLNAQLYFGVCNWLTLADQYCDNWQYSTYIKASLVRLMVVLGTLFHMHAPTCMHNLKHPTRLFSADWRMSVRKNAKLKVDLTNRATNLTVFLNACVIKKILPWPNKQLIQNFHIYILAANKNKLRIQLE